MIRLRPGAPIAVACVVLLALPAAIACGEGDQSRVSPADIRQIVASLPSLQASTAAGSGELTDKQKLPPPVLDQGLAAKWKGQYAAEYQDVRPGVQLMLVSADVYKTRAAAQKRYEAQPVVLRKLLDPFAGADIADITLPQGGPACAGMSVKQAEIVSEHFVYCRVDTTVIYVQVNGADESTSIDLASTVADEFAGAISAAVGAATPSSTSG